MGGFANLSPIQSLKMSFWSSWLLFLDSSTWSLQVKPTFHLYSTLLTVYASHWLVLPVCRLTSMCVVPLLACSLDYNSLDSPTVSPTLPLCSILSGKKKWIHCPHFHTNWTKPRWVWSEVNFKLKHKNTRIQGFIPFCSKFQKVQNVKYSSWKFCLV